MGTLCFLHQDPPAQMMRGTRPTSQVTQQDTAMARDMDSWDAIDRHQQMPDVGGWQQRQPGNSEKSRDA